MYQITLVKEKVKRNQVVAFHLIAAIILIVMGFITFVTPFSLNIFNAGKTESDFVEMTWVHYGGLLISLVGLAIVIITIFFNKKVIQSRKNLIIRWIEILCFLPILIYCIAQEWYLPAFYSGASLLGIIFAYILEKKQEKQRSIVIDNTGLHLKTNSKDSFWSWPKLEHFIIKYNVVTLRTTDKKLYQFITESNSVDQEAEIIKYAQDMIKKHEHLRQKDDW